MPPCVTAARVLNEDPVDRFSIGGSANNEGLEDLFFSQWEQITQNLSFYLGNIAYIPYIHILIIAFTQAILFGSLLYNGQNYPAVYLQYSPLATTLVQPTVINLRVATLAIACTLVLDLAIEGALSVRLSRFGKSSTCRAELIIRCIFILSLLEPNIILLCIPSNPYTVVVAYATSTLQQIMLFSASMFVFSYALDKTPRQCCRSLLLSFTFAFAQLMYFFVSMTGNPTASSFMILSIISVVLSALPPIIYFGMSISSMWTRWLKKTNESETHTTSSMDYLFVAVFVAYTLWCLIHALSAVIIQKLYLFQLTTSDLVIFDVPVILFALITTIAPSWSARLESSKTQVLLSATRKNVKDSLLNPLLKISVGLNMLLSNTELEILMDDKERENLFNMALMCNLAVSSLDDISALKGNAGANCASRSESEGASRKWSFGDVNHGMYDGNLRFGGTAIRHYDKDSRSYQNRVQSGKMDSVDYSEAMDYDSEISEIQDGQKKILYKPKKGSLNYSKMCKPTRKVFVRPSFNLLASSFQNSEEDDDLIRDNTLYQAVPPHRSHTVVDIPVQVPVPVPVSIGTTLRRKASIHSVDRVGSSATIVKSILSESSPRHHQSLASIEGPWVAIPSVSSKVSNVATDHGGQSQKNMAIAACTSSYQLSPLKGEDERFQSECVTTVNISLPDTRQSRVVSVASSATSTFIATKQCTPLQLYSFMPENDSTGFECPFSIIESTNESLLRLLDPHSPVTTSTVRHDSLAILSPAATRKQNKQSRGPVVEQGNVSKEVYARCLSYLANESFTSISPVPTFSRSLGVSSIGVLNSCESNLLVEGCDHLSQFTWKLVEAFHSDLKSAFIVYEALVSTFAPNFSVPPVACNTKEMSISVDTHSPVTTFSSFGEESNNNLPSIFTNPTQLSFDSLCTLEEYLSGVLVLFVKASASLQVAADNVSVMKGRRRKGL